MWDICWRIDCLWAGLRIEARAHGRSIDEIRYNMLTESTGNDLEEPWNTIFNYGLKDHSVVRGITLLALKTAHPDKNDITFQELEKDVIITATNLTDSYFFVCSKQTTPNMSVIDAVVHSCCGNIALTPTELKLRKQNKYACIIYGGASVLNYPLCIFSEYKNPSYIEKC